MFTSPVAAARAVVATGTGAKSEHDIVCDTWKCGSLSFIFTHPPEDLKKKKKKIGKTIVIVNIFMVYYYGTHVACVRISSNTLWKLQ